MTTRKQRVRQKKGAGEFKEDKRQQDGHGNGYCRLFSSESLDGNNSPKKTKYIVVFTLKIANRATLASSPETVTTTFSEQIKPESKHNHLKSLTSASFGE